MKKRRILALSLALAMLLGLLAVPVLADGPEGPPDAEPEETAVPEGNQMEGAWIYEVAQAMGMGGPGGPGGPPPGGMPGGDMGGMPDGDSGMGGPGGDPGMGGFDPFMMGASDPTATLLWGNGDEKTGNVVMIPAKLGGFEVNTIGNGAQTISSNNKNDDVYVLFPEGVTTFSARMIYDYNSTSGWSIPASVTSIASGTFLSCPGTFYGESGSAAETYASSDSTRDFVDYTADGSVTFTAETSEGGWMQPTGTYHLPSGMLDGKHTVTFHMVADYQFKIKGLWADGQEVSDAAGQHEYDLNYTFTADSAGVTVEFEADPDDSRDPDAMNQTFDYEAPAITKGAVADGATLPDDVNDYLGVHTGSTAKYDNTMGISTGYYYAADGKVYEMVKAYQDTDEAKYMSKAEAINGVYAADKLVFGKDYDLIRVYNYYEDVQSGPARGVVELYCTYLYKEIDVSDVKSPNTVDSSHTNTASVFVQKGGDLELNDFTSYCYTAGKGPSEAGNFFGMGSAIHVDGGDGTTAATTFINKATSTLTLRDPQILGTVNSIYSTANGVIYIEGGNVFSCTSGGHGPYVSTGGQILLNTEGTDLVEADGMVNRVTASLTASKRPDSSLCTMARNAEGVMEGVYQDHESNVTVVVTGDEAGTALATDSGGGVIVANQVVTKTFGLRCAGVYSIGSNESWVYCYNSNLTSYLDAGLCSASGGYIYAYNCDINGVMGIKCRAGGNAEAEETGVHVANSRVAAYFDAEEMKSAYDVGDADTMRNLVESGELDVDSIGMGYSKLNMFIDKANSPKFYEDSLDWWFTDKSKTPGYSGGNKFAVMYVENSSTPIYVEASKMVNQNYVEYGDESKLEAGEIPADNLLLSVEGAGSATVYFKDENDQTPWDLTGQDNGTTELVGDFFIGAYSQGGGGPDVGTGPNAANLNFENSQWEGTVLYGDEEEITGVCSLDFDWDSQWKVTADTYVSNLELMDPANITADEPVTVTFASTSTVVPGTYGNVTLEGPGMEEWPEHPEPEPEPEPEVSEAPTPAPEPEATAEPEPEVSEESEEASGIPGGAIAGIIAGVVVLGGGGALLYRKRKK